MNYLLTLVLLFTLSSCSKEKPSLEHESSDYLSSIFQGKSSEEILNLPTKPNEIHEGYKAPGKIIPHKNIENSFYYQMPEGELFVYISNGNCHITIFKSKGIEF